MFEAGTCKSDGHCDVDWGKEPQEDDGEESTDREDDEGGPAVDDCANE